jgi:acyl-CoA synthetase (AMP-forming)/AMP-acid ligase II
MAMLKVRRAWASRRERCSTSAQVVRWIVPSSSLETISFPAWWRAACRMMSESSTGWALPYCAAMVGAKLVLTGRYLDGESLATMMQAEGVTFMVGVPTIWFGLLDELRRTNQQPRTLQRILVAGSALPGLLVDAFGAWGVQAWGMTETSPIVTYNAPLTTTAALPREDRAALKLRQGRCIFGADVKIVDAESLPPSDPPLSCLGRNTRKACVPETNWGEPGSVWLKLGP